MTELNSLVDGSENLNHLNHPYFLSDIISIDENDKNDYIPYASFNYMNPNFNDTKEQSLINQSNIIGKKRQKQRPNPNNPEKDNNENCETKKKKRRKFEKDNVLMKIQCHYMTFIIKFINNILEYFNYDPKERFKDIKYSYKKNIQKSNFISLKGKKLYEIITNEVSKKIKEPNLLFNLNLYEKLKSDEIIRNILNENYLNLFKNVYHKSERSVDLRPYGIDVIIPLSETIEMYNDIEKIDKDYINILNKYVNKIYFASNFIFSIKK